MSDSKQRTKLPDPTATPVPDRPTVYILLPGGWSSDIWHCAAATALCLSEDDNVIAADAITIIGMKEKVSWSPEGSGTVMISPDNSIIHGSRTYNYFHSIKIPILLARINKLEAKFRPAFGQNIAGGSGMYLDMLIGLYRGQFGNPDTLCSKMWSMTPETEKDANVSTLQVPPNFDSRPSRVSLPTEVLFPNEGEVLEPVPNADLSPPYEFDGNEEVLRGPGVMLHLWTSTAITMQYLYDPTTRERRMRYLQRELGNISDENSTWVQQACALRDKLIMLAESNEKRVVLFNYRKGDVNKQHDGNIGLLRSVTRFAAARGFAVVALLVNVSYVEMEILRTNGHQVLQLYRMGESYDKRYTAAFWSIVANELQGIYVQGLIGGRSGSMDIASFMGVNCCTFDEPIFNQKCYFDDDYILAQGGQFLRLMSQHPITSIVYVNFSSWFNSGAEYNAYNELDEEGLGEWLDRGPYDPHIYPPLSVEQVRVSAFDFL